MFRRDMPPVIGRVEQAWRRRDVHAFHHPDALTVRAHAWRARQLARAVGWVARRTRPARMWMGARRQAVSGWCRQRGTALRIRVTGHGGVTSYRSPQVVPGEVVDAAAPAPGAEVIPFPSEWARPDDHGDP